MVKLTGSFSRIQSKNALVIGDLMLDTYTVGKARRISPEAPVAVIEVLREDHRPGGAGNVMLNIISMGMRVLCVGRVGQDDPAKLLLSSLENEGIEMRGVVVQPDFPTPVKNRIIAENQQIVRVDHEKVLPLSLSLEQQLINDIPDWLNDIDIIAISDYGKGFLTKNLLQALNSAAKARNIPIIADPKGIDFTKYAGATVIKPNLGEAYSAANLPREAPLEDVAKRVLETSQTDVLMVTRSEAGISLFHRNGQQEHYPVRIREVKDVTGAGDTVLATLTLAMANGLTIGQGAQLSNIAAGLAIERFGCARITLAELARRLLEEDVQSKVFDEAHFFALLPVLRNTNYISLAISPKDDLSPHIFKAIRSLKHNTPAELLVYAPQESTSEELLSLLASFHDVNFIVTSPTCMSQLAQHAPPQAAYALYDKELQQLRGSSSLPLRTP